MTEFPSNFFVVRLTDLVLPLLTVLALLIAYFQVADIRKHKRIEFTYQLYRDFFNYLNHPQNKDLRDWIFGRKVPGIDHEKIGDLLEQFEALRSLQRRDLIDSDIAYSLFAFYILKSGVASEPTVQEYIKEVRELEMTSSENYTDDIFEGYLTLLSEMRRRKHEKASSDESSIFYDVFERGRIHNNE